jgi:lipopolysaccharide export system protein LptA
MQRIDAFDNVEVISGRDVAKGERGTYNLDTGIANLFGSVKMSRDKSGLSGEQGVLDTNTGVGRLMPAPGKAAGSPRVRGVIVPPPESGDKDEDTGSPPAEEAESLKPDSSAPTVK